jgi:hypothetical protein
MSRGCAVTVYLSGSSATDNRTHWTKWFNKDMVVNFPDRVANHNGGDWDVNEDYRQIWNLSNTVKASRSVKAYNPWMGKPYIVIDDKTFYLNENESQDGNGFSVKRLNDSDDYKEYELRIYR